MTPGTFKNFLGERTGYSVGTGALSTSDAVIPIAGDTWTLLIDTATSAEDYGVNLTAPALASIAITSDGSATKPEIANAIATAWNANATCARYAVARSDGVATVTFYEKLGSVVIVKDENGAKMTLAHVTTDAGADPVPDAFRGYSLRCKLSSAAAGFVPGDDTSGVVTCFLAADVAGDIPLTTAVEVVAAPGGTAPTTKGGFAVSLDGLIFTSQVDRVPARVFVVARLSAGTATGVFFLDWSDPFKATAS